MKVYPVRCTRTFPNGKIRVEIIPFTSNRDAKSYFDIQRKKDDMDPKMLDEIDFTLNKPGILDAIKYTQNMIFKGLDGQSQ